MFRGTISSVESKPLFSVGHPLLRDKASLLLGIGKSVLIQVGQKQFWAQKLENLRDTCGIAQQPAKRKVVHWLLQGCSLHRAARFAVEK